MKNIYLLFAVLLLTSILAFPILAQPNFSKTTAPQLDSTITWLHERGLFNGVILIAENGKPIYSKALGIANLETQEPVKITSAFNLASVSKQFVAMLVVNEAVSFNELKELLQLTDGNLASHLRALEELGLLEVKKQFVGRKPLTTYSATTKGRKAFAEHLDALEALLRRE